jgi:hypothetical protein
MMVTKRKDWYKNKLISVFGGVKKNEVDGYFCLHRRKAQQQLCEQIGLPFRLRRSPTS